MAELERWGLAANVVSDHALRTGAKVRILRCNGDAENPVVRGLDKRGRVIEKYTKYKRLENFRPVFLSAEQAQETPVRFTSKEEAAQAARKLAERWGRKGVDNGKEKGAGRYTNLARKTEVDNHHTGGPPDGDRERGGGGGSTRKAPGTER